MAQLNLKKILSTENISELVDIVNHNFDQIVLNGGGPQGIQGIMGAPGLPGLQGIQGMLGGTGATGTKLFVGSTGPDTYTFKSMPNEYDAFMEVEPTKIVVYSYIGLTWSVVNTVTAPSGNSKLIANAVLPLSPTTSNDKNISESMFIGASSSFNSTRNIINSLDDTQFSTVYSTLGDLSVLTVAGDQSQLRLMCSATSLTDDDFRSYGSGIIHSISRVGDLNTYSIRNSDTEGNNLFILDVNTKTTNPLLLLGTRDNKLVVGSVTESISPVARMSINNTLVVGNTTAIEKATINTTIGYTGGILSRGNLAIGSNNNTKAIGTFYAPKAYGINSNVLIDTDITTATTATSAVSSKLTLGRGIILNEATRGQWDIEHDAKSSSATYGSLSIKSRLQYLDYDGIPGWSTVETNAIHAKTYEWIYDGGVKLYTSIGIGNTDPIASFEIGDQELDHKRIAIGFGGSDINNYIGYNLAKPPGADSTSLWTLRGGGGGGGNGGSTIWNSLDGNLHISTFGSTGTGDRTKTHTEVINAEVAVFGPTVSSFYETSLGVSGDGVNVMDNVLSVKSDGIHITRGITAGIPDGEDLINIKQSNDGLDGVAFGDIKWITVGTETGTRIPGLSNPTSEQYKQHTASISCNFKRRDPYHEAAPYTSQAETNLYYDCTNNHIFNINGANEPLIIRASYHGQTSSVKKTNVDINATNQVNINADDRVNINGNGTGGIRITGSILSVNTISYFDDTATFDYAVMSKAKVGSFNQTVVTAQDTGYIIRDTESVILVYTKVSSPGTRIILPPNNVNGRTITFKPLTTGWFCLYHNTSKIHGTNAHGNYTAFRCSDASTAYLTLVSSDNVWYIIGYNM